MDDLEKWQALKERLTVDQFARQYEQLFFVARRRPASAAASDAPVEELAGDFTERVGFATDVVDVDEVPRQTRTSALPITQVLPIVKAPGNPFRDRISIGRARTCDIVLRDGSVSKLHAHVRLVEGRVEVVDRDSANGTKLNGRRLEASKPTRVELGDTLIFGAVALQVVDAAKLYELL